MDKFCHTEVLLPIVCLLVREVGLTSITVAFLSARVKFVSLELLLCKRLFDLFLAQGTSSLLVLSK